MITPLAASLVDVLGTVVGVLLGLTGFALATLGGFSAVEGTVRRGIVTALVGTILVIASSYLIGLW